jgi:hypothetical protein
MDGNHVALLLVFLAIVLYFSGVATNNYLSIFTCLQKMYFLDVLKSGSSRQTVVVKTVFREACLIG